MSDTKTGDVGWNVSCLNDSSYNESELTWFNHSGYFNYTYDGFSMLYPYEVALCSVGIVFNVVSLLALLHVKKPTRRSPFHLALRFLACTDLLFSSADFIYAMSMLLYTNTSEAFSAESLGCWDEILNDFARLCMVPPLVATTGIVIVQAVSILCPLRFSAIVNKRRVLLSLGIPFSLTICIHLSLHIGHLNGRQYGEDCWQHFYGEYLSSSTWYLGLVCTALELFNCALYTFLWWQIKAVLKKDMPSQHAQGIRKDIKLHVTIGLLLVTIILFWTPAVVMLFLMLSIKNDWTFDPYGRFLAQKIAGLFALLNPIIDPIVYGVRLPEVKDGYRRMWTKLSSCWRKKREISKSGTISDNVHGKSFRSRVDP
ncbi:adrenocorticotropic hormone receptor-like [Lingula anatina]|uniref:Adrenocorticotropic hormone receptor-like n=1 Tax=Lingula anatina TaxID=7574 RepID=A0A1S3JX64_LINAN|nr:adrenocorticotropic hormone receptor-like [Lingula anatina]|eukprot:XP_013414646.1 adrenocorticotropic hormone receptor-like [Lingula anatina]